jgi:RNA polymerase sigma-70 factor (ECF subfamily)
VEGLLKKNPSAMEYLYDHYSGALFGVIVRIVKTESVAEEVLQDVLMKIWDRIDRYNSSKGKLFTWMVNIARNQAIDKTRSGEISRQLKTSDIGTVVNRIDNRDFTESKIEGIGIRDMLKSLPSEQFFVIEHLYFKGYTQSELAEDYNIPLGTIKTRLRLALQYLRNCLEKL